MLQIQELKRHYSNEQIILVLLSRLYFSTAGPSEISDFIGHNSIDWRLLYKTAKAHGIRPFIYHIISHNNISTDPDFEARLLKDCNIAKLQGMQKVSIISKLVNEFKSQGITIIPYKGPVFAHSYYENIGLRESTDIDFIAAKNDVAKIEDWLITNGYAAKETVPRPYLKFFQIFFKDITYTTPNNQYNIEIHWALTNRFAGKYPSFPFFASHLTPYSIGVLNLHKLEPAYDFIGIISNHFVKDMFIKFKYIIDVACILQKHPELLNKPVVSAVAQQYGFRQKLEIGLSLVSSLTGIGINEQYSKKLPAHYLSIPLQYPIILSRLQFNDAAFLKRSLKLQDNRVNKCKFIIRSFLYIFVPSYIDINTFNLPVYFFPALIFLRPFRLMFEKIKTIKPE